MYAKKKQHLKRIGMLWQNYLFKKKKKPEAIRKVNK